MIYQYLLAVEGGIEIAESASETTSRIAKGWDTVWQQTIVNPPAAGGGYAQVVWVATWVGTIGCLIFMFNNALKLFGAGSMSAGLFSQGVSYFLIPVFIWVGISNDGALAGNFSYGINRLILYSNEQIMQVQIASTTFSDAITNLHLTNLAQNQLRQEYEDCMNLKDRVAGNTPTAAEGENIPLESVIDSNPQFQCFQNLRDSIAQMQAEFEAENCNIVTCNGAARFFNQARRAIGEGLESARDEIGEDLANTGPRQKAEYFFKTNIPLIVAGEVAKSSGNYLAGGAIQAWLKPVLYAFQFDYMNTLIGGMFLCGMSAPIAIAASLIPFSPRTIWVWLIAFFSFGMAIFYYDVLIGTVATLIVAAEAETFSSLQYPLFLGLFAPAISSTLAIGGAWAAAKAAQANGHAIAAASFSAVSTVATSALRLLPFV